MIKILKDNRYFFIPYIFTLLICMVLLLSFSKPELHILSNKANSLFFDYFFKYITNLGDGVMIAILAVALLFVKYRYSVIFLSGSLITAAIINIFKEILLDDILRPLRYFEIYETYKLHIIEGLNIHLIDGFPSGHTGTAFNVFLMLALISPRKWLKLFWFFVATVVGYSRVYISQHFLIDITFGSIIGTATILLMFIWISKSEIKWLDKSLIHRNQTTTN